MVLWGVQSSNFSRFMFAVVLPECMALNLKPCICWTNRHEAGGCEDWLASHFRDMVRCGGQLLSKHLGKMPGMCISAAGPISAVGPAPLFPHPVTFIGQLYFQAGQSGQSTPGGPVYGHACCRMVQVRLRSHSVNELHVCIQLTPAQPTNHAHFPARVTVVLLLTPRLRPDSFILSASSAHLKP